MCPARSSARARGPRMLRSAPIAACAKATDWRCDSTLRQRREHRLLLHRAASCQTAEQRSSRHRQQRRGAAARGCGAAHAVMTPRAAIIVMGGAPTHPRVHHEHSLKTLLIVAVLVVILWNLGAGLYYMMVDDKGARPTAR